MSSWANRRKGLIVSALSVISFLIVVGFGVLIFYNPPLCSDGKQNGSELGVDCGGECQKLCPFQASDVSVLWARSVEVNPGQWNAVAYINNPNQEAGIRSIDYTFKAFDSNNILIAERKGSTFIASGITNAIVEPSIVTGNRIPARTFFEFTEPQEFSLLPNAARAIILGTRELTNEKVAPKLTVVVSNTSLQEIKNIEATAVIFDHEKNAMAASRTELKSLKGSASESIVFTWPRPFPDATSTIDIVLRVRPQ